MKRYGLFLGYIALVAYAPLVFVTAKTISFKKLRDLTFLRAMAKDYLRTLPVCAIVALPALVLPPITPWYAAVLHLVFALPLALELGHVHMFGTRVGLNTFYSLFVSNARETKEFFRQNISGLQRIMILALLLVPPVVLAFLPVPGWTSRVAQATGVVAALLLSLPFFLNFRKRPEKRKDGYILNPFSNIVYNYVQFKTNYKRLQELIAKHAAPPFEGIVSSVPPEVPETYVVVIGESSNSQHHHYCGYPRETNEFTDRLGDELLRFKGVRSPFAQTIPALEKTITFADNEHPDLVWTKGSIVDFFHDAGFETYWLSNQYALDDTALTAMTAHADVNKCYNFSGMKRFEKAGLDGDLLPDFAKFIRSGKPKKVLFLHLIGSHSAYVNRYPDSFKFFDGQVPGRNLPQVKAQMLNSYDDSIRYTDWVIASLIEDLKSIGGVSYLLYFSDHGEDIYDTTEDKVMGHSQIANLPMTSVPFMLWTSKALNEIRPDIRQNAKLDAPGYSLQDSIHTIIDISSLSSPDFRKGRSIFGDEWC